MPIRSIAAATAAMMLSAVSCAAQTAGNSLRCSNYIDEVGELTLPSERLRDGHQFVVGQLKSLGISRTIEYRMGREIDAGGFRLAIAAAVHCDHAIGSRDVILYHPKFMADVKKSVRDFILLHEIGHVLNGDTTRTGVGLEQARKQECAADMFAGSQMAWLGYSEQDAVAVLQEIGPDRAGPHDTHPPRDKRLECVRKGWLEGGPRIGVAVSRTSETKTSVAEQPRPATLPATWKQEDNKYVNGKGYVYWPTKRNSMAKCIGFCDQDAKCRVVEHNRTASECILYSDTGNALGDAHDAAVAWKPVTAPANSSAK